MTHPIDAVTTIAAAPTNGIVNPRWLRMEYEELPWPPSTGISVRKRSFKQQEAYKVIEPYVQAGLRGETPDVKPEHVELLRQHYPALFALLQIKEK